MAGNWKNKCYDHFMKRIENLSQEELEETGRKIGAAFVHETGPFSDYFTEREASIYFTCLCQMAVSSHCLYELSDEKGYLIAWRKHHGPSFFQKLLFSLRISMKMDMNRMQKYMDVLKPWKDYEEKYRWEKDYIDLFMVCIPLKEQGKGNLRKLLKESMKIAEEKNIPCILDTDSERKMKKYRHIGFTVTDDLVLPDGNHMYTMEYRPESEKTAV